MKTKNPSNNENLFDINYIDNNMFRTQRYRSLVKLSVFQHAVQHKTIWYTRIVIACGGEISLV